MHLIHDTRDKPDKHKTLTEWLEANGHSIIRSKMYVGDISNLHDMSVCIDLKQGMQEVYSNLVNKNDHKRFRAECERAVVSGIKLIVLVQEAGIHSYEDVCHWDNPRIRKWYRFKALHEKGLCLNHRISTVPPMSSEKLARAMATMTNKYKVEWQFCAPEDVGAKVIEILSKGGE